MSGIAHLVRSVEGPQHQGTTSAAAVRRAGPIIPNRRREPPTTTHSTTSFALSTCRGDMFTMGKNWGW